ncbi:YhdH/YhfP family quinone oxidoreductase [Gilvimarinus sp. DA14]|uniref:YhdH/YhfP family quinone oxidoreductase n=1 Tax=Gilvimarinus sp. DA14 TaxID=2956798 RepID=UPI0020B64149|nr:YhdH/YhfP family quinone oxidoreductase [Gilvimarinus sp. DA14]UTF60588.1 YhdH/YhfP family quinone oxidoreductase [Gilvimarinus sp. DA14]
MTTFQAVRIRRGDQAEFSCSLESIPESSLEGSGVLIDVHYSGLNYKDALSAAGNPGVSRNFPHTPGIDAAGVVRHDPSGRFSPGQRVLVSGYDFGMNTSGGLAEVCSAPDNWVCECPESLTLFDAMLFGTPGLTVAQALDKLQRLTPHADGEKFVISGASGAVGSLATVLARHAGFEVVALTGKRHLYPLLQRLGASECLPASEWTEANSKALLKPQWRYGLDTLGGEVLLNMLKATEREGAIASCGLALSPEFSASVYPFILRGVSMLGVDSAEQPLAYKQSLWRTLAEVPLTLELRDSLAREISLAQVPDYLAAMLRGQGQGRVVVKIR